MKRLFIITAGALLCTSAAWGAACAQASLASYISLGSTGCTIADKTFIFGNTSYTETLSGGATAIGAGGIQVTPLADDPNNPGLRFSSTGWTVGLNQAIDSLITFIVNITSGPQLIKDASILQLGPGFAGTGQVTVTEGLCGNSTCSTSIASLFTKDSGSLIQLGDNVIFAGGAVSSLFASKDILVSGGSGSGNPLVGAAAVSAVDDRFSQTPVPEPASVLLLGTCLLGLGKVIKKFTTV